MERSLKHKYNPAFFESLCDILCRHLTDFNSRDFIFRVFNNRWPDLDLHERVKHISGVLNQYLAKDRTRASEQLADIAMVLRKQRSGEPELENLLLAYYLDGITTALKKAASTEQEPAMSV